MSTRRVFGDRTNQEAPSATSAPDKASDRRKLLAEWKAKSASEKAARASGNSENPPSSSTNSRTLSRTTPTNNSNNNCNVNEDLPSSSSTLLGASKRGRGLLGLSGGVRRNAPGAAGDDSKRQKTSTNNTSSSSNSSSADDAARSERFRSMAAKAKSFNGTGSNTSTHTKNSTNTNTNANANTASKPIRQSTPKKSNNSNNDNGNDMDIDTHRSDLSNSGTSATTATIEQINSQFNANQPPTPPKKSKISFCSKTPEVLGPNSKSLLKQTSFGGDNTSTTATTTTEPTNSNEFTTSNISALSDSNNSTNYNNNNNNNEDDSLLLCTEEEVDTTGDVSSKVIGLKSRLAAMLKKITLLEEEKMALSMAKAPLEARFRQREDQFKRETDALKKEIGNLKQSIKEADEKFRNMALQKEQVSERSELCYQFIFISINYLHPTSYHPTPPHPTPPHPPTQADEENTKLTLENRKIGGVVGKEERQTTESSGWARQLQNDRDVADLKDKLKNAQDEINGLKLDKVSLETDVKATSMELDSMNKRYESLKGQSDDIESAKNAAREAEIRLEVLTQEHIATAAQLNATSSDLAATKSSSEASMKESETAWKEQVSGAAHTKVINK